MKSNSPLMLAVLLALTLFSCKKELPEDFFNIEAEQIAEARQALKTPQEINFFDFGYVSSLNQNISRTLTFRNEQDSLTTVAMHRILLQNAAHNFVPELIQKVGYPIGDKSKVLYSEDGTYPIIAIPFATTTGSLIKAFLIGVPEPSGVWSFLLADKPTLLQWLQETTSVEDEKEAKEFFVANYLLFDKAIFEHPDEYLEKWMSENGDDEEELTSNENGVGQRCLISFYPVGYCAVPIYAENDFTNNSLTFRGCGPDEIFIRTGWQIALFGCGGGIGSTSYSFGNSDGNGDWWGGIGGGNTGGGNTGGGGTGGGIGGNPNNSFGLTLEEIQRITALIEVFRSNENINVPVFVLIDIIHPDCEDEPLAFDNCALWSIQNYIASNTQITETNWSTNAPNRKYLSDIILFLFENNNSIDAGRAVEVLLKIAAGVETPLTEQEFKNMLNWLRDHKPTLEKIEDFLDVSQATNDEGAKDFASFAISLMMEDSEIKWDRLEELYNVVRNNPNALVENCFDTNSPLPLSFWSDLASFTPPQIVLNRINSLSGDWHIQDIEDASGKRINLDYFPVTVNTLPKNSSGVTFTADDFLSYIRKNINNFATQGGTHFDPIPGDESLWLGNNPLTAVISITIAADDGSVITSQYEPCCWIFSTLRANSGLFESGDGWHPVSGNRQFGYTANSDGSFTFYTKGADRLTNWYHNLGEGMAFTGADGLWTNFQSKIREYVNDNSGSSPIVPGAITHRPDWSEIRSRLKSNTPITFVPCD